MNNQDRQSYRILAEIESDRGVTQRSMATKLGIALGLTNLLIKRLVRKGFIKVVSAVRGRRLQYLLTPRGIAEKTRLSIAYLDNTIYLYTETREKVRQRLREIAIENRDNLTGDGGRCRIVFYGAGEVAEIAYVVLDDSMFEFVGVVDDVKGGQKFFGHWIGFPDKAAGPCRDDYDRVIVTTFKKSRAIRQRLESLDIPGEKISFL